ncbi:MAG: molybdate ABC transporter permease subunit [Chloroflexi bacterium]|nr:molybdate ABC transporter permease subunit [Chloroflexota bacterium]
MNLQPLLLSIQVTFVATIGILVIGLALALFLARTRMRGKIIFETLINLPLVLPPSVVGYYLLIILGREGPLVRLFDVNLLFTWQAAVVAAIVVAMPLMVQSAKAALESVDATVENAARTLGSTEIEVIWRVTLPLARRGIIAGLILGSARALGEFGATLMVAGNIPGRTQTAPLAIYDAVQAGRFGDANFLVLMLTVLSLSSLFAVSRMQQNPSGIANVFSANRANPRQ